MQNQNQNQNQRRSSGPMSLAQITRGNLPTQHTAPQYQRPSLSPEARKAVSGVFIQLQSIFAAWKHAFPTDEMLAGAKREFAKALIEAGVTSLEQVAVGMREARKQTIPFFPAPGMFIKWCEVTPESLGMPSIDQALHEIARHKISHPAVKLAAMATRFERGALSASEYRPIFEREYGELVRRAMAGENLEASIPKALPTRDQVQHSHEYYREAGLKGLALVKAQLGRRS